MNNVAHFINFIIIIIQNPRATAKKLYFIKKDVKVIEFIEAKTMVKFLTTSGSTSAIEQVMRQASKNLILITPYVKFSSLFIKRLAEAIERGVKVTFVYGKDYMNEADFRGLTSLPNITLYYNEDLHAKCYYNERQMIITSMNLHEYSQYNNWEMGVLLENPQDEEVFLEAVSEANAIIRHSYIKSNTVMQNDDVKEEDDNDDDRDDAVGYCIRCKKTISFDPGKPLCDTDFSSWNRYKNPDYEEKYCHSCGRETGTSYGKPLCITCFKSITS